MVLQDVAKSDPRWAFAILRYFNPVGAHVSGMIGEDPNGIPNNLLPYISQVAVGKLKELAIFGDDYDTQDGTGVRDYIHVTDLAKAHKIALSWMKQGGNKLICNLGTGRGYSVLEILRVAEKVTGRNIPFKIVGKRSGDPSELVANPSFANKELNWHPEQSDINTILSSTWNSYRNINKS